jgi:hypothetical protein
VQRFRIAHTRESNAADESLLLELAHGSSYQWKLLATDAVAATADSREVVQNEGVHMTPLQPLQASFERHTDCGTWFQQLARTQSYLGSDNGLLHRVNFGQSTPEVLLREAIAVLRCRVEVRQTVLECVADDLDLLLGAAANEKPGESASAEAERRDNYACIA